MVKRRVIEKVKEIVEESPEGKFLVLYGEEYREVEARDWWDARKRGAKVIKEELKLDLPLGLIEKFLKVVRVTMKYKKEDFKELI